MLGPVLYGIGSSTAQPGAKPKPATHTVVMEAVAFQPVDLTVRVGDTVVWVNKDPFPHTATASRFDSKVIPVDGSWKYTAKAAGEFPYVCIFHPPMKGTVRVK